MYDVFGKERDTYTLLFELATKAKNNGECGFIFVPFLHIEINTQNSEIDFVAISLRNTGTVTNRWRIT